MAPKGKAAEKGAEKGASAKGKGKGKAEVEEKTAGKVKGAQQINVRHILVGRFQQLVLAVFNLTKLV